MTIKAAVLIIFVSPLIALSQSDEPVHTEVELVGVLCRARANEQARGQLLKSHPQLVNIQLWNALMSRAVADYYGPSREESIITYEVALEVASQLHRSQLLAKTYYNIGRTYSGLNQLSKAVEAYEKSKALFEQAGSQRDLRFVFADLGRLYFILEDYDKAKTYSERSLSAANEAEMEVSPETLPVEFAEATALATLADIHLRDGDYEQAIEKLQRAKALHEQLSRGNRYYNSFIADDFQTIGRVYTASGDYSQALIHLNQALVIVKTLNDPDATANLLNSIGVLYLEQEDYLQAKKTFDESLQIYLSLNKQKEVARVLLNLGVIDQRQSNYDQALTQFRLSLEAAKATNSVDTTIAAGEGIGAALTAKKDFKPALDAFNQSLTMAKDTNDKTRQTEILWRTAETYFDMKEFVDAAALAESAVNLARASHLPKLTYLATTTLGQSYAAQNKVEIAIRTMKQAVEQLEEMRYQVAGTELERQLFLENKVSSYDSLVDILAQQDRPVDALLYAEKAKARVLLDTVSGNSIDFSKNLTPGEREQQLRLNQRISYLTDRAKHSAGTAADQLYSQLDSARLEYQAFQDSVYVGHPEMKLRSGRSATLDFDRINDLNLRNTAYLEYAITKRKVWLFVFAKASNGVSKVTSYPLGIEPDQLRNKVNLFHDRLANRHPDYATLARELYAVLVGPAEKQLQDASLCIVPDSFLWNLPFQALMTNGQRFLIEDHALYYAPSLSVLYEMEKNATSLKRISGSLIALGNPVIGKDEQRNEELCPLPEAETEVKSIAASFSPIGRRVLIGREATEKSFRALAPAYSTIHLATHGVIDNRQPLYSHLLLTKTDGDLENDGLLEAREIMNMNLRADLAVLSACETANGTIRPGEGVVGMSWAFFVAGTHSMLVSQWKVNSASTSELMINFYERNKTTSKATALQQTSLTLMKDRSYRHPFYWAGFVLIGRN